MDQRESVQEPTGALLRRLLADVVVLGQHYGLSLRDHYKGLSRDVLRAALLVGAALVLGVFALGLLVAALVLVVAIWLPAWAATLVVLGVIVLVAVTLVLVGLRRVRRRWAEWAARVEEEVRWLKSLFPRES